MTVTEAVQGEMLRLRRDAAIFDAAILDAAILDAAILDAAILDRPSKTVFFGI